MLELQRRSRALRILSSREFNISSIPAKERRFFHVTLKPKDLVGIPWSVAFALRSDGWWLRSDIIWEKPNPMPESVTDRPTRSHEYLFLLAKSQRYYYDAKAIAKPTVGKNTHDLTGPGYKAPGQTPQTGNRASWRGSTFDDGKTGERKHTRGGRKPRGKALASPRNDGNTWNENNGRGFILNSPLRNKRDVWTIPVKPFPESHFATFPPKLVEPCVLAGSRRGDLVLDPFLGAGTTGMVALWHGRRFTGIELNPEYIEMARRRITEGATMEMVPAQAMAGQGPLFAGAGGKEMKD